MVEVLVSLFIVSMGVLALAGLVTSAARLGKAGESRALAALLAADLADRLRANPEGAAAGDYDWQPARYPARVDPPPVPGRLESGCAADRPCLPAEIAAVDLFRWRQRLLQALPGGFGSVVYRAGSAEATPTVDVWVAWVDVHPFAVHEPPASRDCPPAFAPGAGAGATLRCVHLQVTP